jgi:predicted nucleic acid-binding Zn ribbon protein
MKDEPLKTCPKCSDGGLKRLLGTGAGLIFKGSGFYITDYKKGGGGSSDSGSSKGLESKSTGSSGGSTSSSNSTPST